MDRKPKQLSKWDGYDHRKAILSFVIISKIVIVLEVSTSLWVFIIKSALSAHQHERSNKLIEWGNISKSKQGFP